MSRTQGRKIFFLNKLYFNNTLSLKGTVSNKKIQNSLFSFRFSGVLVEIDRNIDKSSIFKWNSAIISTGTQCR